MEVFVPEKVFYEINSLNYKQGKELIEKYKSQNIECNVIRAHHHVPEHRQMDDSEFVNMKKYLVLGERKTQRFVPNEKTSDYLVPYTSSGCPAICTYCYLVCNFFKCSYLRVFLNREKLFNNLIKKSNEEKGKVYELGSTSDLIIENTITGNLPWTIEEFGKKGDGHITLPTKFHMIDDIIGIEHKGKTTIRMSVNPDYIIKKVEIGTSSLDKRIKAMIKLFEAGYKVGMLIAPIILVNEYENLYEELMKKLADELPYKLKKDLDIEIIFMTYSQAHVKINKESLPNVLDVYDKDLMKSSYRGKLRYKNEVRILAESKILNIVDRYLPECNIVYVC